MKIKEFATNKKAEIEGVWQEIGQGAKVKVARAGNVKYSEYVRKLSKPYMNRYRRRMIPEDIAEKITIRAMSRFILLGWEGIEGEDGNHIQYSEQKAIELLTEYPDFRELVASLADDITLFQLEAEGEVVEEIKNT